jgi:hypothetical protein
MMRRIRTRLPTYLSTGLGALLDIAVSLFDEASTQWTHSCWREIREGIFCEKYHYDTTLSLRKNWPIDATIFLSSQGRNFTASLISSHARLNSRNRDTAAPYVRFARPSVLGTTVMSTK